MHRQQVVRTRRAFMLPSNAASPDCRAPLRAGTLRRDYGASAAPGAAPAVCCYSKNYLKNNIKKKLNF